MNKFVYGIFPTFALIAAGIFILMIGSAAGVRDLCKEQFNAEVKDGKCVIVVRTLVK